MKLITSTALLLFVSLLCSEAQDHAHHIIERYRQYLWATARQSPQRTGALAASLKSLVPDVDGKDHGRALTLLHNTRDVALAWSDATSPFYHNDSVRSALDGSLQRCLAYFQKNLRWALYQPDVVRDVRDIIMLLHNDLTAAQQEQGLEILRRHSLQGEGTGPDMAITNELGMHYGALTNDTLRIARCSDLVKQDIVISQADGIQPDLSFHGGGKRLDMFQSGKSFLLDNIRIAWQLQETPWKFPGEKIDLLTSTIVQGWQWMARGIHTVPGVLGSYAATENALKSADIRPFIPFLKALDPAKAEAFVSLENWQNGKEVSSGVHYWPYSDLTAYHQKDFSFFVKTISDRTLPSETGDMNRKGHLLSGGDAYLVRDGMEYFNLMPVWNWQRLPGVTSFDKARVIERKPLAGNASNGRSSVTAMQLLLRDSLLRQHLSGYKFWAAHDSVIVCLLGGMEGNFAGNAYTTLDQCRWRGDVTVNKPGNILKAGSYKLDNVHWIHHGNFVYIRFPRHAGFKSPLNLELKQVTGNWKTVSSTQPDKSVTENIFQLSIDHGHLLPEYAGNDYVLAHAATPQAAHAIASNPQWGVLRNSNDCQVVYFKDGTIMGAFYTTRPLESTIVALEVSAPCLLLIERNKLYVSDLSGKGKDIRVKWNSLVFRVKTLPDGATVEAIEEEVRSKE